MARVSVKVQSQAVGCYVFELVHHYIIHTCSQVTPLAAVAPQRATTPSSTEVAGLKESPYHMDQTSLADAY